MTLPKRITSRIRSDAEGKYKKPKDFQRKTYVEANVIEWERKAYEKGATTEATRAHELVKAPEEISKVTRDGRKDLKIIVDLKKLATEALNKYQKPARTGE